MSICTALECARPAIARKLCSLHYQRLGKMGLPPIPPRGCMVQGCSSKHEGRGFCKRHYWAFRKHGDPLIRGVSSSRFRSGQKPSNYSGQETCSIEGCVKPHRAKGWCHTHYMRWFHRGSAEANLIRKRGIALERFEFMTNRQGPILDPNLGRCWLWKGEPDQRGYGRFSDEAGWSDMAHRWAYKHFVGQIPDGLVLDHRCYNPPCVNPAHLEPVTHRVNVIDRGRTNASYINSKKTHCNNGHEFKTGSFYIGKTKYGLTRVCKACHKRRVQNYHNKLAARVVAA